MGKDSKAGQSATAGKPHSVSRLPPLPQPLDPLVQEMFEKRRSLGGGAPLNSEMTTGHAPKFFKAARDFAFALRFDADMPIGVRELAIVRTAEIVGSDYELFHHKAFMKKSGYSDEQVAAVSTWRTSKLFNDKERAILAYVEGVTDRGNVDDETFSTLQRFFNPKEIVELTLTVTTYYGTGLMLKSLKVRTDDHFTVTDKR